MLEIMIHPSTAESGAEVLETGPDFTDHAGATKHVPSVYCRIAAAHPPVSAKRICAAIECELA